MATDTSRIRVSVVGDLAAVRFLLHEICLMKITASDIDDLALGAVFLATGGGGDPYLPTLIAKKPWHKRGSDAD